MENIEPKFRKFNIHIEPNEAAVAKSGNIDALHDFITELINDTLDEDITILVVRIPDELELDQETSNDIEVVMAYLREEFATQSPKTFVLGSLFDIKCTNKPNKIVMWPEIMKLAFEEAAKETDVSESAEDAESTEHELNDAFYKAVDDMIAKMNAPKIITPGIII